MKANVTVSSTIRSMFHSMFHAADSVGRDQHGRGNQRRSSQEKLVLRQKELDQLLALGIHPEGLAGRLRLVLTIGCYHDFRFTRDILSTGAAYERADLAIKAL